MIGTYEEITGRMRKVSASKNDSALAEVLTITPQALSNYKKRGKMPASLVVKIAEACDCSLDYLFRGVGEDPETEPSGAPRLDMPLIHGDSTIMELNMAYRAIGYKLKPIGIVPLTEPEKVQIDIQLNRHVSPPEETTEETPLKVAPEAQREPSEAEKESQASVATEESVETTEAVSEKEDPVPNALGSEETH